MGVVATGPTAFIHVFQNSRNDSPASTRSLRPEARRVCVCARNSSVHFGIGTGFLQKAHRNTVGLLQRFKMDSASEGGSSVDAMSLGSDGSDYVYEEQMDLPEDEIQCEYDEFGEAYMSVLFDMVLECRNGETTWDQFLQRLQDHPEEVHRSSEYTPTILHKLLFVGGEVPSEVYNAVLDECGQYAARIDPFPVYVACEEMGRERLIIDSQVFARILNAYPEAISMRHHLRAQAQWDVKFWPLHALSLFTRPTHRGTLATRVLVDSCAGAARILLDFCPEMALEKSEKLQNWNREGKKTPVDCFCSFKSSLAVSEIWSLLVALLKGTSRALYSTQNANEEEMNSLLLHTLLQTNIRSKEIFLYLLETMPHLAKIRDTNGNCALHLAVNDPSVPGIVLQKLVELNPSAVSRRGKGGKLVLHSSAENSFDWSTTKCILDAEPRALKTRDKSCHMYPFMLAAVGERADIDVLFELLLKDPTLARGLSDVPPGLKNRFRQLEKERDEAIQKSETLRKEHDIALEKIMSLSRENEELRAQLVRYQSENGS